MQTIQYLTHKIGDDCILSISALYEARNCITIPRRTRAAVPTAYALAELENAQRH